MASACFCSAEGIPLLTLYVLMGESHARFAFLQSMVAGKKICLWLALNPVLGQTVCTSRLQLMSSASTVQTGLNMVNITP